MPSKLHEDRVRKLMEIMEQGNYEDLPEIMHPEYKINDYVSSDMRKSIEGIEEGERNGIEGWINRISRARARITDTKIEILDIWSSDEKVCIHVKVSGMHTGSTDFIKATNHPVVYSWMGIYSFKDTLIHDSSVVLDSYPFYKGMGLVEVSQKYSMQQYTSELRRMGLIN